MLSEMGNNLRTENNIVYDIAHYYWQKEDENPDIDPEFKATIDAQKAGLVKRIKKHNHELVLCYDWTYTEFLIIAQVLCSL